jgi:hypothetical protein
VSLFSASGKDSKPETSPRLLADGPYHLIAVAPARVLGRPGNTRKGASRQAMPARKPFRTLGIPRAFPLRDHLLFVCLLSALRGRCSSTAMNTTAEKKGQTQQDRKKIFFTHITIQIGWIGNFGLTQPLKWGGKKGGEQPPPFSLSVHLPCL